MLEKKKTIHVPRFPVRFVNKNQSGQVYDQCGLLFSVQSLNNFWMMSIRNCSVGSSGGSFWDASTGNFSWPMSGVTCWLLGVTFACHNFSYTQPLSFFFF